MKRSRYTSLVPDYPEPGQHLLFNWLTQAMVLVDDDLHGVIGSDGSFDAAQIPADYLQQLQETGLIIADAVDETQEIRDWYRQARCDCSTFRVMVLTTYDCNFACPYCVEEGWSVAGFPCAAGAVALPPSWRRATFADVAASGDSLTPTHMR